jgi:hypothetical protein
MSDGRGSRLSNTKLINTSLLDAIPKSPRLAAVFTLERSSLGRRGRAASSRICDRSKAARVAPPTDQYDVSGPAARVRRGWGISRALARIVEPARPAEPPARTERPARVILPSRKVVAAATVVSTCVKFDMDQFDDAGPPSNGSTFAPPASKGFDGSKCSRNSRVRTSERAMRNAFFKLTVRRSASLKKA